MDIIRLLPDNIANQIAAGEVIQRPASAVKELLENAVDSGATHIKLLVKQAGKSLVQVIDNGCGMSETDARMCFEKHATSKIQSADDLFNIRTMGFRGEALASIAAIAQVELKTKQHTEQLGTSIDIEGMKVLKQEPCQTPEGTSIAIKNLFFNVPARRNFLKSDSVELKNILEEFHRVALAHPKIGFQLFSNDYEMYHLKPGNLRQRICALFGDNYDQRIVPVEEKSYALHVYGFAGKPEFSKKTRGEQFIFVNNRYIKSPYLNHAVSMAYDQMMPKENFPFYVLFLDIDPSKIDINVHPAKYEIKFEDEKLVYTFVNLGVKHAMGAYSVSPTLDFNQEHHLNSNDTFSQQPRTWLEITQHAVQHKEAKKFAPPTGFEPLTKREENNQKNWQSAFDVVGKVNTPIQKGFSDNTIATDTETREAVPPHQLHRKYIVSQIKSGFILIDQQAAHERVMYERYLKMLSSKKHDSQRQLFPQNLDLNVADAQILKEILPDINNLGFDIQEFGKNSFVIHGFPSDILQGNEKKMVEELIEQFKMNAAVNRLGKRENLAKSLATSSAIKAGKQLSVEEMKTLIDELFACENPYTAPNSRHTFITLSLDELTKRLENK
ncbi:MAG: DNA mismatch repair endonuclease MutL [Bacteroidetes bacterium]|nr:DNA mismatch repair endonuclease MutL [Bacteroidota bacterium]MBK8659133.1 DNA mismatch repair endonuclease MutL [Bacteroidota bacterium]